MFDIGGPELVLVIILAVIFVGPRDLPRLMRSIGAFLRKARMVARDFQRSFEDMANQADLEAIKKETKKAVDEPLGQKPDDDKGEGDQ